MFSLNIHEHFFYLSYIIIHQVIIYIAIKVLILFKTYSITNCFSKHHFNTFI
jgi:hypothetical protein